MHKKTHQESKPKTSKDDTQTQEKQYVSKKHIFCVIF